MHVNYCTLVFLKTVFLDSSGIFTFLDRLCPKAASALVGFYHFPFDISIITNNLYFSIHEIALVSLLKPNIHNTQANLNIHNPHPILFT